MDLASSDQWSRGCESGWTVYLDESYISTSDHLVYAHPQSYRINSTVNQDQDQSMVSDASSGPPLFPHQVEQQCYSTSSHKSLTPNRKNRSFPKKRDNKKVACNNQHGFSSSNHLDDTASSPTITYSQMYANPTVLGGYSQNMSATHSQGSSSCNNHYGFWQSNNHLNYPDQSAQPDQLGGRGWEQ